MLSLSLLCLLLVIEVVRLAGIGGLLGVGVGTNYRAGKVQDARQLGEVYIE